MITTAIDKILLLPLTFLVCLSSFAQKRLQADVVVIGGGTGGTAAGIQSARSGANTIIIESSPWLGGMISAAGVSATDGNHRLPSGIWNEFRNGLYKVYGGPNAVETGWVSNTQFEPRVADSLFKDMAAKEEKLTVLFHFSFLSLTKTSDKITAVQCINKATGEKVVVTGTVFIDATELGDVLKAAGEKYSLGMEAGDLTGEKVGVHKTNDIIQDLTYVAILKDYGAKADCTILKPRGYDPDEFDAACTDYYKDKNRKAPGVNGQKMLEYGKLPGNKYMLNWPNYGNDTYLNLVELTEAEREKELVKAKEQTLRFIYFIQHQLGYRNLGLADDEFPTPDRLALMPYHREGRRVAGLVRFTMRHISEPFTYGDRLYLTGVSVGDYPIDHHHKKNPSAPQHLEFYPVPSFNIPLGALLPRQTNNLIIAEKGISVSNVANGTTRLQPCVLLTGQAAGTLAGLSVSNKLFPKDVPVRLVQQALLNAKAYIMPYIDVSPDNPHFEAIQKIGATGILRGTGIPYKWANQTWFYPDSLVTAKALSRGLIEYRKGTYLLPGNKVPIARAIAVAMQLNPKWLKKNSPGSGVTPTQAVAALWRQWGLKGFDPARNITRLELAVLLQNIADPFSTQGINHKGHYKTK